LCLRLPHVPSDTRRLLKMRLHGLNAAEACFTPRDSSFYRPPPPILSTVIKILLPSQVSAFFPFFALLFKGRSRQFPTSPQPFLPSFLEVDLPLLIGPIFSWCQAHDTSSPISKKRTSFDSTFIDASLTACTVALPARCRTSRCGVPRSA